jgi:tetratricopeptide (TPR) repeat protein
MRSLWAQYQEAVSLTGNGQSKDALQICAAVLQGRPANVLFASLEEKAKSREWVARFVIAGARRAQTLEQEGHYAEALEEWEALREVDPKYAGVDSEILHCAALKQHAEAFHAPAPPPAPSEIADSVASQIAAAPEPEQKPAPVFLAQTGLRAPLGSLKIAITEEAWNHLKTGLAATFAFLLVLLVLASKARK